MNKKIVVLLKIYKGDLNPFDECALESALSYKDAEVTVLAMSPLSHKETLESLTRLGAKAILISDPLYAGSDTIATSKILARAIELLKPDFVFAGRQSVDGNTAQVPLMLSELTKYELVKNVLSFNEKEVTTRLNEVVELTNHQLLTFEKFKLLRSPSIFSKKDEIKIWTNKELNLDKNDIGINGSPTRVIKTYQNESDRRFCEFVKYNELDKIIKERLELSKKESESEYVSKAPLIYYVGNIKSIAKKYGTVAQEIDVKNLSTDEVIKRIKSISPKIILWEENTTYKELASRVAIRLNVGLCADCTSFRYDNNRFVITRPALGGDIFADIVCVSSISMATVRNIEEKEDDIAIVIGRGAVKYLDKIYKLKEKYNANLYCSRPLADEGIIDYSKQVGLTGIMINPKIVINIGSSGAIQHIVGFNKAGTVIAINILRKEKIFDYADFGVVMDIKDM